MATISADEVKLIIQPIVLSAIGNSSIPYSAVSGQSELPDRKERTRPRATLSVFGRLNWHSWTSFCFHSWTLDALQQLVECACQINSPNDNLEMDR